tara:strand:+ start:338 stop:526 length:189 start_codon:yes stop_codon:yes gene_type:complete
MLNFNDYVQKKREDEEARLAAIREEKKRKELEEETRDAGWDSFDSNPKLVDQYIEYITRKDK